MGKLIVGLTGGIACGKTIVSNYLAKKGAFVVDADVIAREVVYPNSKVNIKVSKLLGKEYLLSDGNLNRKKIKQLIFSNTDILKAYEDIILPAIRTKILLYLNSAPKNYSYTLLVAPLLFEKGLNKYVDKVIVIDTCEEKQIKRLLQRDNIKLEVIKNIIKSQLKRTKRNQLADYIIDNNSSLDYLFQQLDYLHNKLCNI